ncbi:MAG: aminotransferase class I/II-fold pyridoxal phosphate-dependent enzyme [Acetatifactor sp.]|nr:aminotransferase class I/II-fold pyridoxal phosphate-dependent enzyme [Acetatifactor sp.]
MREKMSLFQQLNSYGETDYYPYHMPGHKRRKLGEIPEQLLKADITEIDGFDNLHQPEGILRELQERANALYGAEESFYLINGSTGGILTAVSAALSRGEHLLMARDCHKSAYHAAYLRGLKVSYLYAERVKGFDFNEAVTPGQVEQALAKESDIGAVLIVSPTYEGRIADIEGIARVVHSRGIPLLVDEAHGAHLGFAEGFAPGSCTQGADIVVHSVHKTLPAMTQTALLHVNGNLIDREQIRRFLHIYQSSSPSYLLMAGICDALEIVERQGEARFARFRYRYKNMLERLEACHSFRFVPWQDVERGRQDIGKLVIDTGRSRVSGQQLYRMLLEQYHLQCEMAAGNYCLAMFTMADEDEAYDRMERALLELDGQVTGQGRGALEADEESSRGTTISELAEPVIGYSLAEAWDMPWKMTKMSDAVGCPVADFINLYPPGIPLLVPGEVLTESLYRQIIDCLAEELSLQGIEESGGEYFIKTL